MTKEELLQLFGRRAPQPKRAKPRELEHNLQCACVHWFRYAHSRYSGMLFAIPNGGLRNAVTAKKLKEEGVLAGVADLMLAVPNRDCHGLFIEMKTEKGRQQDTQRNFQQAVTAQGYRYEICRNKADFIYVIDTYLNNK